MLVLTRKENEIVRIGADIEIKVVSAGHNVKLGITAPKEMYVCRVDTKSNSMQKQQKNRENRK